MKNNKLCLITGASSGIGEALTSQLIAEGYRVIGTSRNISRLDHIKRANPSQFLGIELDVESNQSVDTLLDRLPENWREISVLVNNAGSDVGGRLDFNDGLLDNWLSTIETNVKGVIRITYRILEKMRERNSGDIINIGSTSGLSPVASTVAYSASKHAINGFSESLRLELKDTDIRVQQILPGMVRTEFAANRFADKQKADTFYKNYGVCLTAADVARSIVFAIHQPAHVVISQLVIVPK